MINNQHILYILPFKNGRYFKFGITKEMNFERIKHINRIYGIDIERGLVYYGNTKDIVFIENQLKNKFCVKNHEYKGRNGYTEVRNISELKSTISILKEYKNKFDLQKFKLKKLNYKYIDYELKPNGQPINYTRYSYDEIELPKYDLIPLVGDILNNYPPIINDIPF